MYERLRFFIVTLFAFVLLVVPASAATDEPQPVPNEHSASAHCGIALVGADSPDSVRFGRVLFVGAFGELIDQFRSDMRAVGMEPQLRWAADEGALADALEEPWDAFVTTAATGPMGVGTLTARLRAQQKRNPVIFVVDSPNRRDDIVMSLRSGAYDYVSHKDLPRLAFAIVRGLHALDDHRLRQQAEEGRRQIFDMSEELLFVGWPDGSARQVNAAYLRVLGYTPEEFLALNMDEHIHAEDRDSMLEQSKGLANGRASFQVRQRRKDGTYRTIAWNLTVSAADGSIYGVGRDVTEAISAQRQQQHDAKMRALGQFAAGIAHDFNNLLTIVIGYLELAQSQTPLESDNWKSIDEAVRGANRAVKLVAQISSFGRPGKMERKPTMLSSVVEETVTFARPLFGATIDLVTKFPAQERQISADAKQLGEQVVLNIAKNARDAINEMPGRGGIGKIQFIVDEVVLDGSQKSIYGSIPSGTYMRLRILDNGPGIAFDALPLLFEPYYTTKPPEAGTGLGLAIVHKLVRDHGGWIDVSSVVGTGTAFDLYFPTLTTGPRSGSSLTSRAMKEQYRDGSGISILVVDDERAIRELLRFTLAREKYSVTLAQDGQEAWELFQANPTQFAVVLTDLTMQKRTGLQLARQIRETGSQVPILLLTGHHEIVKPEDLTASGISALLAKPPQSPGAVLRLVEKLLESGKAP